MQTYFASPERLHEEDLSRLSGFALSDPIVEAILESVNGYVLVLSETRQILAANDELLEALGREALADDAGKRPGELLGCIHAVAAPSGCGTSVNCRYCGAVLAILASQKNDKPATDECLLLADNDGKIEAHEYCVRATPLKIKGERLTVFVLRNIDAEKRRSVLQRVFFHDVANLLGSLSGLGEIVKNSAPKEVAQGIVSISQALTSELRSHRMLLEAEQNRLVVHPVSFFVSELFDELETLFALYAVRDNKKVEYRRPLQDANLFCDERLVQRVLINMLKNALEASPEGGKAKVRFETVGDKPLFVVENSGVIPADVQLSIFKRSFSTKGEPGRGIGTYSMKLFGEQYLGGEVWFTSDSVQGTRFYLSLPLDALAESG